MKKQLIVLVAVLAACLGVGVVTAGLATADPAAVPAERPYKPHPKTIVEVTGDAENGFEIFHYDGSADFPPTRSEARAECREYDESIDRIKCRQEIRVWYRDLGDLKRAINYAQSRRDR